MKVLKAKGARNYKRFGVKIPTKMHEKIVQLEDQIKAKGYQVDWSEPCEDALKAFIAQVEKDLEEA